MSGESSEKNEKPTAKRLREAREKGQVIKSVEITSGGNWWCWWLIFSWWVTPSLIRLVL